MSACPGCGERVGPEDRFCEACGTGLRVRRAAVAPAVAGPAQGVACRCGEPAPVPAEDYCPSCGLRRPEGNERVEQDLGVLAGVSDRGHTHPRNEDALAMGRLSRWGPTAVVVCDGVSTVQDPQVASRTGADTALGVLLDGGAPGPERMRAAVARAAAAVTALAATGMKNPPCCTLVSGLVDRPAGAAGPVEITVGWVGDSRAYWLAAPGSPDRSRLLTQDHSWAAEQVAAGELAPEEAARHPLAHSITRWLGADGEPDPGVVTFRPNGPGVLLLCSDGLWNYRPEPDALTALTMAALERGPLAAAAELTAVALDAGGRDNITVAVVPIGLVEEPDNGASIAEQDVEAEFFGPTDIIERSPS